VRILCWGTPTCGPSARPTLRAAVRRRLPNHFRGAQPPAGRATPPGITRGSPSPHHRPGLALYDASWEATTAPLWRSNGSPTPRPTPTQYSRAIGRRFYVGIFTFRRPTRWRPRNRQSYEIGPEEDVGPTLQTNHGGPPPPHPYYDSYTNRSSEWGLIITSAMASTNFYKRPIDLAEGVRAERTGAAFEACSSWSAIPTTEPGIDSAPAEDLTDPSALHRRQSLQAQVLRGPPFVPATPPASLTGILPRTHNLPAAAPTRRKTRWRSVGLHLAGGGGGLNPRRRLGGVLCYTPRLVQYGRCSPALQQGLPMGHGTPPDLDVSGQRDRVSPSPRTSPKSRVLRRRPGRALHGNDHQPCDVGADPVNQGGFKSYSITPPRTFGSEFAHSFLGRASRIRACRVPAIST